MEARGLAAHQGYDEDHTAEWWAVENETASLYMAYLVGSVCREDNSLFPVTDTRDTLLSLTVSGDDDVASRLRALRYAAYHSALPVPSRLVPADELLSFKDRYADLLNRLRHYLNGQLVDLAMIDDDFARNAKTEGTLQNIHDDVAVLTEQMHKRRWPRIMLAGVGGLTASALTIGTAVSSGGLPLPLASGLPVDLFRWDLLDIRWLILFGHHALMNTRRLPMLHWRRHFRRISVLAIFLIGRSWS